MTNKVYIIECPTYEEVEQKLEELLNMMGGIEKYVAEGDKVALKANLLSPASPEKAITTHPALVAAVGKLAKSQGTKPFIIDGPSGASNHTRRTLERFYAATGMEEAAERAGIDLNLDDTHQPVSFLEGHLIKHFDLLTPLVEADVIISLPKFKTHTLMAVTGAVKNNFGAIPGRAKPGYHGTLPERDRFAQMLLDLADCVNPRLSIMDAVVGMEGDGPSNGTPRQVGYLLASENPLALDIVASEMMGLPPARNPILREAKKRGMHPHRLEDVDLIGAEKSDLRLPNFALPSTLESSGGLRSKNFLVNLYSPLFKKGFSLRPHVVEDICVACGDCIRICPETTIAFHKDSSGKKHALIDDSDCIRCYCCHEICPEDAIELRKGLLYRVLQHV